MRARYLAVLLLPLPVAAYAQPGVYRDSIITVSTQRTMRVGADRASFYMIVEGIAETPADAVARVQTKMGAVTEAIHRAAPDARLDRPIEYGVSGTQSQNGYPVTPPTHTARSIIRVQTDHPDRVAPLVGAAIAAGAMNATGLFFELASADSVRRAHLAEALAAARADAEAIAAAMRGRLGAMVDVSLAGNPVAFNPYVNLNFDSRAIQPSSAPEVTVSTVVTVRYRLAP